MTVIKQVFSEEVKGEARFIKIRSVANTTNLIETGSVTLGPPIKQPTVTLQQVNINMFPGQTLLVGPVSTG